MPPSGTLTVVVTVTIENVGNWTVVPELVVVFVSAVLFHSLAGSVAAATGRIACVSFVVVVGAGEL